MTTDHTHICKFYIKVNVYGVITLINHNLTILQLVVYNDKDKNIRIMSSSYVHLLHTCRHTSFNCGVYIWHLILLNC